MASRAFLLRLTRTLALVMLAGTSFFEKTALADWNQAPKNIAINASKEEDSNTGFRAVITCSVNRTYYIVSVCFSSLNGFQAGTLKVTSGVYTSTFPQAKLVDALGYNAVSFHLLRKSQITAKIPSIETGLILHVEVKNDSGRLLYKDDTGYFNSIRFSMN